MKIISGATWPTRSTNILYPGKKYSPLYGGWSSGDKISVSFVTSTAVFTKRMISLSHPYIKV